MVKGESGKEMGGYGPKESCFGSWRGITADTFSLVQLSEAMISGSLSPWHGASSGCGWRNNLQYGG